MSTRVLSSASIPLRNPREPNRMCSRPQRTRSARRTRRSWGATGTRDRRKVTPSAALRMIGSRAWSTSRRTQIAKPATIRTNRPPDRIAYQRMRWRALTQPRVIFDRAKNSTPGAAWAMPMATAPLSSPRPIGPARNQSRPAKEPPMTSVTRSADVVIACRSPASVLPATWVRTE